MRARTAQFVICILVSGKLLIGCGPQRVELFKPIPPIAVEYQDQAARGGLAVVTVAEWDDYVADLQPTFALTAEQALQRAIPVTFREVGTVQDALTLGIRLAPPTSSSSSTSTDTSNNTANTANNTGDTSNSSTASGLTTTTSTQTSAATTAATSGSSSLTTNASSSSAGNLSKVPAGTAPSLPSTLLPASSPLNGAIEINPMTLYTAATALYQEVKLLNRYVRDAALRKGFTPYVLRLQVSVLPQLRGQAYDAYAMLSFLTGGKAQAILNPYAVADDIRAVSSATADVSGLTVVPLLVTDSMEQSAAATSLSRLRGLSAGVMAMQAGFGASAEVARQLQTLQSVLGEDTNSLMTVTKVSDSSLRVRFGAVRQVGSGLALEARNHTVTLLVLVPTATKPAAVKVVSKLSLVRATDGFLVPERPLNIVRQDVYKVVCRYTDVCGTQEIPLDVTSTIDKIAYAVQRNDHNSLSADLNALHIPRDAAQRVWVDVLDIVSRGSFSEVSFELPEPSPTVRLADSTEPLSAVDDGTATVLRVPGVPGARAADLVAALKATRANQTASFFATQIDDSTNVLRLVFPSMSKLGICSKTEACSSVEATLTYTEPRDRWATTAGPPVTETLKPVTGTFKKVMLIHVDPSGPKSPPVGFMLASGTRVITRTPIGEATLALTVQLDDARLDETVFFNVEGANVGAVTAPRAEVKLVPKGWQVTGLQKGVVVPLTLALTGLGDDIDVKVTASNGQASREPLVFRVRTQAVQ